MKSVKNLVFVLLLVFTVTATAAAGEMPIPPAPAPAPGATTTAPADTTLQSSDPNYEQSGDIDTSDYLFDALAALLTLY
jgi:hypothetical protein